jgi:hypothetical protein
MRAAGGRELLARQRPLREKVRDPKCRRYVDSLGELIAVDEASEGLRGPLLSLARFWPRCHAANTVVERPESGQRFGLAWVRSGDGVVEAVGDAGGVRRRRALSRLADSCTDRPMRKWTPEFTARTETVTNRQRAVGSANGREG